MLEDDLERRRLRNLTNAVRAAMHAEKDKFADFMDALDGNEAADR